MPRKPKKLYLHILPAFVAVAFLALGLVALGGYGFLDRLLLNDQTRNLETQGRILSGEFSFLLSTGRESWVDQRCESLGRETGYRYTVILSDGKVAGDSIIGVAEAENHLERPEVRKALGGEMAVDVRTSRSTGDKYLFVAIPLNSSGPKGVLRIAKPFNAMMAVLRTIYFRFLVGLLIVLGMVLLFSLELARKAARKLARPLQRMVSFLIHVGDDGSPGEEFDETGAPEEYMEVQKAAEGLTNRFKWAIVGSRQREDELRDRASQLDRVAHYDPLTGFPNRTMLYPAIEEAVKRAAEEGGNLAVMFCDLDRFKAVNDTLGHETGDILLQRFAQRMKTVVGGRAMVARLGGDEFCALVENVADREEIASLARNILEGMEQPFVVGDQVLEMTMSIGISLFPSDGTTRQELLHAADMAMYAVKRAGRDGFAFSLEGVGFPAS